MLLSDKQPNNQVRGSIIKTLLAEITDVVTYTEDKFTQSMKLNAIAAVFLLIEVHSDTRACWEDDLTAFKPVLANNPALHESGQEGAPKVPLQMTPSFNHR